MQRAMRVVDSEPLAQRIEVVALAGEHLAREAQRVGELRVHASAHLMSGHSKLKVEKSDVERRVVNDPLGATREIEELGDDVAEFRLAAQVVPRLAMDFGRAEVDVALRVDEELDHAAGRAAVDDLEAGQLDDPMALQRIEAGRLGVEDDLTHFSYQPSAVSCQQPRLCAC